jgi:DNA-binding response OmpR family regulator
MKILVIEDEPKAGDYLRSGLGESGYVVDLARNGRDGLHMAQEFRYDLILLDVMMPEMDGWEVMRRLGQQSGTPVLFLTARGTLEDRLKGLDLGADDYLVKPFSAGELLARVRAHLRRRTGGVNEAGALVEFGDVKIDLARRSVERAGAPLHLTPIEYRLLTHLLAHPHCVLTHRQVLKAVWGSSHAQDTHYVRVYMGHLRRKIEADPSQPRHLITETGIGYRFVP